MNSDMTCAGSAVLMLRVRYMAQVAKALTELYRELCKGDLSGLERLRATAPASTQSCRVEQVGSLSSFLPIHTASA